MTGNTSEPYVDIETSSCICQDSRDYIDVDCFANYAANQKTIWKLRIWLDRKENTIHSSDVVEVSDSDFDPYREDASPPADIRAALEKCAGRASMEKLLPAIPTIGCNPDYSLFVDFGKRIGLDWTDIFVSACRKTGRDLDSIPHQWKPVDAIAEVFRIPNKEKQC